MASGVSPVSLATPRRGFGRPCVATCASVTSATYKRGRVRVRRVEEPDNTSTIKRWAYFRHAVIGALLIAPAVPGQLRAALREFSRKSFSHPVTGVPTRVGFSTLEKWFYAARSGDDPCAQLSATCARMRASSAR